MAQSEVMLLGGVGFVNEADANEGFRTTPESGVEMRITTKRHVMLAPAGEVVCKRMFLQAEHNQGLRMEVIPIGNGSRAFSMRTFHQRPGRPGDPSRESLLTPTQRPVAGGAYSVGLRASTLGVQISSFMPESSFNLESIQFEVIQLQSSRGRDERESS